MALILLAEYWDVFLVGVAVTCAVCGIGALIEARKQRKADAKQALFDAYHAVGVTLEHAHYTQSSDPTYARALMRAECAVRGIKSPV